LTSFFYGFLIVVFVVIAFFIVVFIVCFLGHWLGVFGRWLKRGKAKESIKANRKQYDVFISHANADKEDYVDKLNGEIKKLGVEIFYDSDVIKWGDNWKEKILTGIEQAEFAIIVISENFFGREWTEKELNDFLTRQNESGQKIVLPILHNVSVGQMKEKYPKLSEIQAIEAGNYKSAESIAVLFAGQLIERFR